jgi:thiosulfate reductase cytochrome b subunit
MAARRRSNDQMKNRIYRHPLAVRITHWLTALALLVLTMSGLQIFMAHPALYASDASNFKKPVLSIYAENDARGQPVGRTQVGGKTFTTTHVLGWTDDGQGGETERAFPSWATIPYYRSLADGRRWHILFAWVFGLCALVYAYWALRLIPKKKDIAELPGALKRHFAPWRVKAEPIYNPLQKISYFGVVFVLAPLAILSGLALSPSVDAWAPWLPALLGGRQFARVWHFAAMWGLIGFFGLHIMMVSLTGVFNNVWAMITGWFVVDKAVEKAK